MNIIKRFIKQRGEKVNINDIKRGDVWFIKIQGIKFIVIILFVRPNGMIGCAEMVNKNNKNLEKQNAIEFKIEENYYYLPVGCINQIDLEYFESKCGEVNEATLKKYSEKLYNLLINQ